MQEYPQVSSDNQTSCVKLKISTLIRKKCNILITDHGEKTTRDSVVLLLPNLSADDMKIVEQAAGGAYFRAFVRSSSVYPE